MAFSITCGNRGTQKQVNDLLSAYLAGQRDVNPAMQQILLLSFAKITAEIWLTSGSLVLDLTFQEVGGSTLHMFQNLWGTLI